MNILHWLINWYLAAPAGEADRELLFAIAVIAITAWTGSLVAVAVHKRVTIKLAHGLRFMLFACFGSLVVLISHGGVLRTIILVVAIPCIAIAFAELRLFLALRKRSLELLALVRSGNPKHQQAIDDWADELTQGWRYWFCVIAALVAVFLSANPTVAAIAALLLLFVGIYLAFGALIEPIVPQFPRGAFVEWRAKVQQQRKVEQKLKTPNDEVAKGP
jgi:hypothetical protein